MLEAVIAGTEQNYLDFEQTDHDQNIQAWVAIFHTCMYEQIKWRASRYEFI